MPTRPSWKFGCRRRAQALPLKRQMRFWSLPIYLKDLNIEEKIGAEIPVELKVRQSDQVYHFDMIVSGIYDTPNEKSESVIVSKAFLEKENAEMMSDIAQGRVGCGIYTADVVMRDSYMVKDRISELVRNIGGNPDDVNNVANAVRVAPNPIVSNESGLMMWLVAGVFGILVHVLWVSADLQCV